MEVGRFQEPTSLRSWRLQITGRESVERGQSFTLQSKETRTSTFERFIDVARQLPEQAENIHLKTAIPHVESLLADLPPVLGDEVPRPLVEAARELLSILQFPAPDEGWDEFDPPIHPLEPGP